MAEYVAGMVVERTVVAAVREAIGVVITALVPADVQVVVADAAFPAEGFPGGEEEERRGTFVVDVLHRGVSVGVFERVYVADDFLGTICDGVARGNRHEGLEGGVGFGRGLGWGGAVLEALRDGVGEVTPALRGCDAGKLAVVEDLRDVLQESGRTLG